MNTARPLTQITLMLATFAAGFAVHASDLTPVQVTLPTVVVTGHRLVSATPVVAVTLPTVYVVGRRSEALPQVTLPTVVVIGRRENSAVQVAERNIRPASPKAEV